MRASVEIVGIHKRFGGIVANRDMSMSLHGGEVHGLLGQNGAGKSTLVNVLTGHVLPDSGRVLIDGASVKLNSPDRALAAGIVGVYQNLMLVPSMTGLENIALALHSAPSTEMRRRLHDISDRFHLSLALDACVDRLDMAARQRLEFARALLQEPRVLLLDEPTTFLPPSDVEGFLVTVERLARSGLAVLFITHRLDEAREVCDRVTIIRAGGVVATFDRDALPANHDLAVAMLGETIVEPAHSNEPQDRPRLRVASLSTGDLSKGEVELRNVDLSVRTGEILGIAGVDGNGQVELLEAIAGARPMRGTVKIDDDDLSHSSFADRWRNGLQLVSGDRLVHGVVPGLTVFEHFDLALPSQGRAEVLERLAAQDVRPLSLDVPVASLSGGNQQKVILARAVAAEPKALLLAYPTQGLDVKAAAAIHAALIERAKQGVAIVVVSSDLDELLTLCDRITVIYRGCLVGEQLRGATSRRQLAQWFTGLTDAEEHNVAVA